MNWNVFAKKLQNGLSSLSFTTQHTEVQAEEAFLLWQSMGEKIRNSHNTIFLIGNGASAGMASHYATDLGKNANLRTSTFSDISLITAVGNDIDFSHIFSDPLSRLGEKEDMLITISSSGNSPNIIRAIECARAMDITVVTLSAMQADNKSRSLGELNVYVPVQTYGLAETAHTAILHHWTDCMVASWHAHLEGKKC